MACDIVLLATYNAICAAAVDSVFLIQKLDVGFNLWFKVYIRGGGVYPRATV
jgi:hypothetical protein